MKRQLSHDELGLLAEEVAISLIAMAQTLGRPIDCYPIPRGGVPAFYLIRDHFRALAYERGPNFALSVVENPEEADVFIDDLVDSGKTQERFAAKNKEAMFYALITKGVTPGYPEGEWLVFPWEESAESSIDDAFVRLLQFVGEDPEREGLKDTPRRMAKAWQFWTSGYKADPAAILKKFEDGAQKQGELIHQANIPFYSMCEHHLAPFFGTVTFGYIQGENNAVVGLSKIKRLINVFARRLQTQERLTEQIVEAFCEVIKPKGAGCIVRGRHLCMESRGVECHSVITTTSALRGVLLESAPRAEFYSLDR